MKYRRICWPNPDATCLEGGCSYCNDNIFRSIFIIRKYAENIGILPNRAKGEQLGIEAFNWGLRNGFVNSEIK